MQSRRIFGPRRFGRDLSPLGEQPDGARLLLVGAQVGAVGPVVRRLVEFVNEADGRAGEFHMALRAIRGHQRGSEVHQQPSSAIISHHQPLCAQSEDIREVQRSIISHH